MNDNVFNYKIQDGFLWSEVNLKGERKYYIEGYASTIDEDKAGEIVGMKAQEKILSQIKNENITLDIEHSEWYDDNGNVLARPKNTTIPVAKVVDAELRDRGVWIKAEINTHIPSFRSVWNSIKDGFLKAFSIAFYPIQKAGKEISDLNLVNITLTGSPVNTNATFNAVMKSAKAHLDSQNIKEEDKMVEEKKPDVKAEEQPKTEEAVVKSEEQPKAEEPKQEEAVVKSEEQPEEEEKEAEEAKTEEPEVKSEDNKNEELVAEIKALREEVANLKAEMEKPVMKATAEEAPKVPKEEQVYVSPLGLVK